MKQVGFIIPSDSGHMVRGIGAYIKNLLPPLKQQAAGLGFEILEIKQPFQTGPEQSRRISNFKLKIIHYPYFDLFYPTLPLRKPAPTVVTIHDVTPLEFPDHFPPGIRGRFNLLRQKLSLINTERIIADSFASVNPIRKYLGVPHSKIKFIHLAPMSEFKPVKVKKILSGLRKKYRLPEKFVPNVGDVNWNKNLPALAAVCREINTPLVLVGKKVAELENLDTTHPELAHLEELKPLLENIIRTGFVPDEELAGIFSMASVYCQPSFAEGFGLSVINAMHCGCPVVCSRTHSLSEVAGDAAAYFDPYSVPELVSKLKEVISDSGLRKNLITAGLKQSARFTWKKTARQTLQVYSEICAA